MPCGVFGSFGWSGEAVDEMEQKLKDAGFGFAFDPIRVKFRPTAKDLQVCLCVCVCVCVCVCQDSSLAKT
jgi:flavorubredoxin